MVFDNLFRKDSAKAAPQKAVAFPQKKEEKKDFDVPVFETPFEGGSDAHGASRQAFQSLIEAPDKLLAEEILDDKKLPPHAPKSTPKPQQSSQKIPAFVSLDKYKEIRRSLRDMRAASAEMRKTLERLRQNRDTGISLLNETVGNLERLEGNIDKIKGVLRT